VAHIIKSASAPTLCSYRLQIGASESDGKDSSEIINFDYSTNGFIAKRPDLFDSIMGFLTLLIG
jgi:hypothetical protein